MLTAKEANAIKNNSSNKYSFLLNYLNDRIVEQARCNYNQIRIPIRELYVVIGRALSISPSFYDIYQIVKLELETLGYIVKIDHYNMYGHITVLW